MFPRPTSPATPFQPINRRRQRGCAVNSSRGFHAADESIFAPNGRRERRSGRCFSRRGLLFVQRHLCVEHARLICAQQVSTHMAARVCPRDRRKTPSAALLPPGGRRLSDPSKQTRASISRRPIDILRKQGRPDSESAGSPFSVCPPAGVEGFLISPEQRTPVKSLPDLSAGAISTGSRPPALVYATEYSLKRRLTEESDDGIEFVTQPSSL